MWRDRGYPQSCATKRGTPPLSGLSHGPEVTEQKKRWCIPFFWEKQGKKGIQDRVYTIEASDPEKEKKEGFHGSGAYFSLPWLAMAGNVFFRIIFPPPTPKSADFTFGTWFGKKSPY